MAAGNSLHQLPVNRGWTVTFAGLGINLALGVLYTWSVFKGKIEEGFGWDKSRLNDPYALCCLVFAFAMIAAGKCQDKFGPRITATIGGVLVGAGMILTSTTQSYVIWMLGFGVLVGLGLGFGYSSATPPALKWFPPSKTGLIAGLVVAGFGLASVYIAPTAAYLLGEYGVQRAMLIFGVAFVIIVCGLAQLLVNPPDGYVAGDASRGGAMKPTARNWQPGEVIKTPAFWLLWFVYFIGAGAGLMVIGSVSGMAKKSMGSSAFIAVALLAIGNAGGRIAAGFLSDKIGRRATLILVHLLQAVLMFIAIPVTGAKEGSAFMVVVLAIMIGANYGANLSLFPSFAKDFWGLKNFGMNYGVLFTAWGVGGLVMPIIQQNLYTSSKSYHSSFITAGVLLLIGALLCLGLKNRPAET